MAATAGPLLHSARSAGRSVVRRLDAGRVWSYFALPGVSSSTSGIVGSGGNGARPAACRTARRLVCAATVLRGRGLRRISCRAKGCSMRLSLNGRNNRLDPLKKLARRHDALTSNQGLSALIISTRRYWLASNQPRRPRHSRPAGGLRKWYDDQLEVHQQIFEGSETSTRAMPAAVHTPNAPCRSVPASP